jgi:hypothetical protein
MHILSAAAAKQRPENPRTRAPSNSSFPNRHNGDFRYVKLQGDKLQKKNPAQASRALRGKVNLYSNVTVKNLMRIFSVGSDLMLA